MNSNINDNGFHQINKSRTFYRKKFTVKENLPYNLYLRVYF